MNDATNLYLAVKVSDPTYSTLPQPDGVFFLFDNDHDGTSQQGEDSIAQACGTLPFLDNFVSVSLTQPDDRSDGGN